MKVLKFLVSIIFIGFFITSCDDENPKEYPGNIIIHGSTFLVVNGVDETEPEIVKKLARVYAFNGGSDNDLSLLTEEDWTYELWFRADEDCLIGNKDAANGNLANGACISDRSNNFELYLINDDDADFAIKYGKLDGVNNQSATMTSGDSSINLSFNEWVHVAISRSSADGIAKFYINGTLIDSSSDPIWIQPVNNTWWSFNYMYRSGSKNFFKGSMENIRVSKIDRYPTEFTPNINLKYNETIDANDEIVINPIDDDTILQLDLENQVIAFDSGSSNYPDYTKISIKGPYSYFIKIHRDYFSWQSEIIDEYPIY